MKDSTPISLVITVLTEAESLMELCASVAAQTLLPTETIFVDGGSKDDTVAILQVCAKQWPKLHIKIIEAVGVIAVGRNAGIRAARYDWIAMTDAGCVLETTWLQELLSEQKRSGARLIAGYAVGDPHSVFEEAVVPYALVMPERIDPNNYLPATRSMLLHRSVWSDVGGFSEELRVSEDYAFARAARAAGVAISFARKAVVKWRPRSSVSGFFRMVYAQARDDIRARSLRIKVALVWARYLVGVVILIVSAWWGTWLLASVFSLLTVSLYSCWAVWKNYTHTPNSWYYLPILQFVADFGVLLGSLRGMLTTKPYGQGSQG